MIPYAGRMSIERPFSRRERQVVRGVSEQLATQWAWMISRERAFHIAYHAGLMTIETSQATDLDHCWF